MHTNYLKQSLKFWGMCMCLIFLPLALQGDEAIAADLVDIQSVIPRIQVDLKYATADNFTGQIVYDFQCCLLLREAALRLRDVQDELETMGLGLKIWDGYRPVAAQWKFWELVPDERYVSDPRKGGRHTRGTAVDVTLITKEGQELLMPSAFDDFSEKAHRNYMDAPPEAIQNRELLQRVMENHGFVGLKTEWWHFDMVGWENFPPIGVSNLNGENSMKNYTVVAKRSIMVVGIKCRTSNAPEKGPQDIPRLWGQFYSEGVINQIPHKISEEVIALYCDYEGDYTQPYSLVIGCSVSSLDNIPKGMEGKIIPGGSYAVFRAVGEHPASLIETWGRIWQTDLKRTYTGDYEFYGTKFTTGSPKEVEVFIAIE